MDKQLIVDLSGPVKFETHGRMYLQSPTGREQVTLMSPDQIQLYSEVVQEQDSEAQKLVEVANIAKNYRDRITDLIESFVLINTLGGVDTMRVTVEWIREIIAENHGKMISVVAQNAQSLGAVAAYMTDEILCLRGSRFLWHKVRHDSRCVSLEEAARINLLSVDDQLENMRAKTRQVMLRLLIFLMKSGNPVPEHFKKRLVSSLYINGDAFRMDEEIAKQHQRGEKDVTFTAIDLYQPNGEFSATGRELELAGLVTATATVEELVQEVRRRGLNVAFPSLMTPQDKFFVVAELNERARARSLKVEFFIDKDGDVSVIGCAGQLSNEKQKRNLRRAVSMVQELLGKVGTMEYELPPS
jgi:hypothetical protein